MQYSTSRNEKYKYTILICNAATPKEPTCCVPIADEGPLEGPGSTLVEEEEKNYLQERTFCINIFLLAFPWVAEYLVETYVRLFQADWSRTKATREVGASSRLSSLASASCTLLP